LCLDIQKLADQVLNKTGAKRMAETMTFGTSLGAEPWPEALTEELHRNRDNACVGTELVSESERVRVWTIHLRPGERIGFHKHVLDYFWTCLTGGRARSHHEDGSTYETAYYPGETQHARYAAGESKIHDLENIGEIDLLFTTVEFLDSANRPLPIPDSVRLQPPVKLVS
jgi:hypothetical protein